MLLELAVGDAYGAGFEFADRAIVDSENDLSGFRAHPYHPLRPGRYTDDTQMSLALAEAIVSGDDWTPTRLADRFVDAFHRDPRKGYSRRMYHLLDESRDGADFLARITPRSNRSGAAMRAVPLGIFATPKIVAARCRVQARLTHDTPDGIAAALAVALASHYCLYGLGEKADLPDFLDEWVPVRSWGEPWRGWVGVEGMESVRAALTAVLAHDHLSDILRASIAFGGDVDTVATIALGIASTSREVAQDLPSPLVAGLENGAFGRDYLRRLDADLLARKMEKQ